MTSSLEPSERQIRYDTGLYSGILGLIIVFTSLFVKRIPLSAIFTILVSFILYGFYLTSFTYIYPFTLENELRRSWLMGTGISIILLILVSMFLVQKKKTTLWTLMVSLILTLISMLSVLII